MINSQEQALGIEKFQQNQALFRKYSAVDGAFKNQIVTAVEPVFLSPLADQLIGLGQVSALNILQDLLSSYRVIYEIDLNGNSIKMMGTYDPAEPLAQLVEKLEKGGEFAGS